MESRVANRVDASAAAMRAQLRSAARHLEPREGRAAVLGTTLWFKEAGEPTVWHVATERIAYGWYRTECGWELRVSDAAAIWPAKLGDHGPAEDRCRSCVEMHAVSRRLARRLAGVDARSERGVRSGD